MTWAIVAGLITLGSFLITVGMLGFKLSAVLTRLDVTVKNMGDALSRDRKERNREHEEMYAEIEAHGRQLQAHEIRLHDLEREDFP